MRYITTLSILILTGIQVFSQDKNIRAVNAQEYSEISAALKDYCSFMQINLNDTAYEAKRAFNMKFTPNHLFKSNIPVFNKDSGNFVPVFDFVKQKNRNRGILYTQKIVSNPLKKPLIVYDPLRKYYFLKIPVKQIETIYDTVKVTDTVITSRKAAISDSASSKTDTSLAVAATDTLTITDTLITFRIDTIPSEKSNYLDFYFRMTETQGKFSGFKIAAVCIPGQKPEREPLTEEMAWWIKLPKNWKKFFREKYKLTEYPEYYQIRKCQGLRELDISGQPISDISFLANFKFLTVLNLSKTQVKDLSPIKNLKSLKELNLSGSKVDTLLFLQDLINLEILDISGLPLQSLENLSGLVNMKELTCSENKLKDVSPLANMTLLEELDISLNYSIKDVTPITELQNLEKLVLKKVEIKDLEPLTKLQNLIWLDVYNAGIADLAPLKKLPKLMHLDLSHNSIESLAPIRNLNFVTYLSIASTRISDLSPIKNWRNLEYLNISGNPGIKDISAVPDETLNTFICHYTNISSNAVQRFKKRNPKCKITYY